MEYQISFFDEEPLTWLQQGLIKGSNFAGGKIRIYAAALNMPINKFEKYLKDEYGLGGSSMDDGFIDYDSKGVRLWKFKEKHEEKYSWAEVAKEIKKLISIDKYLSDNDKKTIKIIKERNDGILPVPVARLKI